MREILFRGKRESDGKWLYGLYADDYVYDADFPCIMPLRNNIDGGYCDGDWAVIRETVGQYTGLTDKNGKKIFEGDILEFTDNDGDKTPYEIYWDESNSAWYIRECIGYIDDCSHWIKEHFEVIGNIHDHPEQLEVFE